MIIITIISNDANTNTDTNTNTNTTGDRIIMIRSVFKISCLFLRPRPWQFEN